MTNWKLVPVEPTPEMDNAARDWSVSKYGRGIGNDAAHGCYSAMLEAAPPAPSVPDGWIRAIDEAMVVHHIGIADRADSYEVAKKKLNALLAINSDIARDCSEAPADVARDAERWQMLPAFLAEFQVPYLQLVDKIDAAIEREILGGAQA